MNNHLIGFLIMLIILIASLFGFHYVSESWQDMSYKDKNFIIQMSLSGVVFALVGIYIIYGSYKDKHKDDDK